MNIWTFACVAVPFSNVWTLVRQAVQAVSHEEAETQGKGMIQRELRGNRGHETMKTQGS